MSSLGENHISVCCVFYAPAPAGGTAFFGLSVRPLLTPVNTVTQEQLEGISSARAQTFLVPPRVNRVGGGAQGPKVEVAGARLTKFFHTTQEFICEL